MKKMKNICEVKATPELLNNTKVNDEYLFRNLARKMEKRTKNSCKTKTLCNAH